MVALDLYLEYLRAAFNTCYYCSVTTDHVEELQRKCIKHVRKALPPSAKGTPATTSTSGAAATGESTAAEKASAGEDGEGAVVVKSEDGGVANGEEGKDEGGEKDQDKDKDASKEKEKEKKDYGRSIVSKERHSGRFFRVVVMSLMMRGC